MNILYLLKTLKTSKLSEFVANIDEAPLDINIAIWDAIDLGEIEVDEKKDFIKPLKVYDTWHDKDLAGKILRVVQQYAKNETNITRGTLYGFMKDPATRLGYATHEYLMTLQYLIDTGVLEEQVVSVPEVKKKRPYHQFVFICLPNNPNSEEWNSRVINKWIAQFEKNNVK